MSQQIEYDNYFDERYLTNVNQCMRDPDNFNQYCRDLCTTEMPVLGTTKREVISFPQARNWLRYVENTFVGEDERKNYEDEVINGWLTNKDRGLLYFFKDFAVRDHGMIITKFAANTGLLLNSLGYYDIKELFNTFFASAVIQKFAFASVIF